MSTLIGTKLLLYPFGETYTTHLLEIARAWPVSQSIQCLDNLAIGVELLFEWIGRLAGVRKDHRRNGDRD